MHSTKTVLGIYEIQSQCEYAEAAYQNILTKGDRSLKTSFSSIHSFLSHCAMVSKCLWSSHLSTVDKKNIATLLDIGSTSPIANRESRNDLEHFDERLAKWAEGASRGFVILDNNIGPKTAISIGPTDKTAAVPGPTVFRHFDQSLGIYTSFGQDLNLQELYHEIIKIKGITSKWLEKNCDWQNAKIS